MHNNSEQSFRTKTREFFTARFPNADCDRRQVDRIAEALSRDMKSDSANDIAFHMTDWSDDAAFLVALHLAPDLFTNDEIEQGITACLVHIPNHIAAAAKLAGWPMKDIFNVGATIAPSDDQPSA